MAIPEEAIDLENREKLADAYKILSLLWRSGDRDRELGLHLIFLTWYGIIEPKHLTGFPESGEVRRDLKQMLNEVHAYFEPEIYHDAEMLYVVGLIARMHGFMLEDNVDDARIWEERGKEYRRQYRTLEPNGIDPSIFLDRGAYGKYFEGQAKVAGGY